MNISEPFIKRPIATSLLMVGVILLGLLGYSMLPISSLPTVEFPTIQVVTRYPGGSPQVMTSAITTPLESQFDQISGLTSMTSTSSFGVSTITLQFDLNRDIDVAAQDVQAAINVARGYLPNDLPNLPVYNKVNPADTPILTLAIQSEALPIAKVNDYADTLLAQKLSQVAGVGLVTIEGNQKPAVRIQFNPPALASLGMGPEDLRNAITQANVDAPKGSFNGSKQAYMIGSNDQLISAEQYRPLIIAYKNGAPVHLSDVADVIDGVEDDQLAAWVGSTPTVLLDVQRQPGANIIQTVDRIKRLLPKLTASIPPTVHVSILTDRTETIRASVRDVQLTLILTVALVILVIFLFLRRVWATVIPSVALPLSLIGTFGIMYLVGFSLNNLSLMALTISTGFVVDDAIVMIENIFRYIEAGDEPLPAALKGARQIGFTVISLSISLIAVFIPLLFMTGIVGRLFREFAITLSVAVIVSAIVSLTLTPMMCAKFLKPIDDKKRGRLYQLSEQVFDGMLRFYEAGLQWVLRNRLFTLIVAIATLVLTIYLYLIVPKGLLPQQDTGEIIGVTDAAQNISFKAMLEKQRQVSDIVEKDPDVQSVAAFVGAGTVNATVNTGRLYIVLKPREKRNSSAEQIMGRLRAATKDLQGISLFMQSVQDLQIDTRVSRTQYQYVLEDTNSEELAQWTPKLLDELKKSPALSDVASDQQSQGQQVVVDIDREKASRFGVQIDAIDNVLYDSFGQRQISIIFTQLNQFWVVLEAQPNFKTSPSALDKIYVNASGSSQANLSGSGSVTANGAITTGGPELPLSAFATLRTTTAPLSVLHQNLFPAITVSFNLAPGQSLGEAVKAIQAAKAKIGMPDTIATSFSGTAAEFQRSLASEPYLILAAVVVIYIVLGVLYESYIHPITILSTLPSAGVGALLALLIFNIDFSLIALIGIILLIGIVKKNAIMMIDFALDAEREEGKTPEESIYQACLLRFRPIMMTTMAALLGALPLAIQEGTGAELRKPLGITIVGGLLVSQILTLYTTPVIYLYMDKLGKLLSRRRKQTPPKPVELEPVMTH
ncbi:MAG TPA: multidrug efflux RND transporter permease subunit [Chthoniobacterales bacterium]|nr:multidrug efflux RND transporter permease subunit [Chthoniobacterales bacterium]